MGRPVDLQGAADHIFFGGAGFVFQNDPFFRHAVGKQDMNPDGLTPLNTKADVLGASSDHLIMDVSKENYKLGDTVDFSLDYGALLKLFTSDYIDRAYI